MKDYNPKEIEPKWQKQWEDEKLHRAKTGDTAEKFYSLETFPYPSAVGLHVGHPEGYTAEDINARYQRMNGKNVLYTMGWDAFGLPTENYAIKVGKNPKEVALDNIANFKRQLQMFGFSYDWDRELNTSDPSYYKWTQWLFLQLYKKDLAYRKHAPVNWCESCKTVLAREQVIEGACERCKNNVEQKPMEQWFFKITNYADELLDGIEGLDWIDATKEGQRNWIGKSIGAAIDFSVKCQNPNVKCPVIEVFTTRPDTLFGATYMVLAPEHELVDQLKDQISNWDEIEKYRNEASNKTEMERVHLDKEKTGVELKGVVAINPANQKEIPVWIADYVMASYGTGAIMAVPAHDERDYAFAKKFDLNIVEVISSDQGITEKAFVGDGTLINSDFLNDEDVEDAKKKIIEWLGKEKIGKAAVTYRLRDWLVSRQRYWGAPIPIIWCEKCGDVPVPEKDLPVLLPDDVDFNPTGEPPLASSKEFQNVECPECGGSARRDYETMDTFVDSSWYFLRYCSPHEESAPFNKKDVEYWMPTDLYVIGAEHIALHLLYARFFCKAFADLGLIDIREPFQKIRHQGMIMGEDNQKMSKSRGNVVNPDEVIEKYGADTMRMYEMFMGPLADSKPWSTDSMKGISRFLEKMWKLQKKVTEQKNDEYQKVLHQTIKKVTEDIELMHYNTAIAQMMILSNVLHKVENIAKEDWEMILKILHPFAPHITEELWHVDHDTFIMTESWPAYDEKLAAEDEVELVVQINGKVRERHNVSATATQEELESIAKNGERVSVLLEGKEIVKVIIVKGKLVNIVIK